MSDAGLETIVDDADCADGSFVDRVVVDAVSVSLAIDADWPPDAVSPIPEAPAAAALCEPPDTSAN
jgi:hypothetical protein